MRLLAAALALCGCNQIYGLDATRARDAAPDAADRRVRLSMLVGSATEMASEAPAFLAKVTPDPKPRIALAGGELANAMYLEDDPTGIVPYPIEYVGKPWRLEYTVAGMPYEVQWSPADGAGHLIVPVVGRVERTQVPANTGYTLSMKLPSMALYNFTAATVIYTSGYWSATPSPIATQTPKVDFSIAPSMSGPVGAPSPAAKDLVFAIDYTTTADGCRVTRAAGTAPAPALEHGMLKTVELALESSSEQIELAYDGESPLDAQSRLDTVLGTRAAVKGGRTIYGRMPHTDLPAFTTTIGDVPAPLMIPLAECPLGLAQQPQVFDIAGALAFTKGVFVEVSNDRVVNGVTLRSSIASVGRLKVGTNNTYVADFPVPCARTMTLGAVNLDAGADGAVIGSDPLELTFGVETGTSFVLDYFEVVLYRLAGATLEPVRTYVGPDPTKLAIRFDPKIMQPPDEYVFAIRTYRGRPNARNADFQAVQAPQVVATIFTRTFKR